MRTVTVTAFVSVVCALQCTSSCEDTTGLVSGLSLRSARGSALESEEAAYQLRPLRSAQALESRGSYSSTPESRGS